MCLRFGVFTFRRFSNISVSKISTSDFPWGVVMILGVKVIGVAMSLYKIARTAEITRTLEMDMVFFIVILCVLFFEYIMVIKKKRGGGRV